MTAMEIDLAAVTAIDNHCHGVLRDQTMADKASLRRRFTESFDPEIVRVHVPTTLAYLRYIKTTAALLGCPATEEDVIRARQARSTEDLVAASFAGANIGWLLLDGGFPPPKEVLSDADLARMAGVRTAPILRLEIVMQDLITEHGNLPDVRDALIARVASARADGYVALKSIAAYRTGLDIRPAPPDEVQGAFRQIRSRAEESGSVRIAEKPLLDHLLLSAFREAARQELPVQFHTGYGDPDTDLRLADPLHLRTVLEAPDLHAMPVVMLHESYPYTRKAGYLATVYGNAHLDLSYGIPYIGLGEMLDYTRAAMGVAPLSKLLYSSDAVGLPEIHGQSAGVGRRIIGQALGDLVETGECTRSEAERFGAAILRDNARSLYGLPS